MAVVRSGVLAGCPGNQFRTVGKCVGAYEGFGSEPGTPWTAFKRHRRNRLGTWLDQL